VIALILGALIAVAAVVIVSLPFLREAGADDEDIFGSMQEEELLELIEERDHALAALKELEFDHRSGKIDDEDYRATVGPLRRAAAEALQALDARTGRRSAEQELPEEEHVQADDHGGDAPCNGSRRPARNERAHQVAPRGEPDQRDEREGDPEGQHDL
jgi:hypothetical protein